MAVQRIHLAMLVPLGAISLALLAIPCGGDLCVGGTTASLTGVPALAILAGLTVRSLGGRASPLVVVDVALGAFAVGSAVRVGHDLVGVLAIAALGALPIAGAVLAVREVAPYPRERIGLTVALFALAGYLLVNPDLRAGGVVPVIIAAVVVGSAFRREVSREAVLHSRPHGVDREE